MADKLHPINDVNKLFYYFFSEKESCSIVMNISLSAPVKPAVLKKALNFSLLRYPNFRQMPVIDKEGHLFTMDNDKEADVYPYDPDAAELGSSETKGFLFRVMHMGKKIWISVFHGVCDGKGLYMFARTLIYNYFILQGRRLSNEGGQILTLDVKEDPSEMADPFKHYPEINSSAKPVFNRRKDHKVFCLPEEPLGVDKCGFHRMFQFVLDKEKLLGLAHEAWTTLDAYFNLLVAKSIRESYNTDDRVIMELGAVDLRPFYKSRYLQNMRELYWVPFTAPLLDAPENYAGFLTRRLLMGAQLQKRHYDGILYESKLSLRESMNFPFADTESLEALRHGIWNNPEFHSGVSFFTTNVGLLELPKELKAFVNHIDIYAPCLFPFPSFFVMSHGKETTVNMVQRHFDKGFALKMLGKFKEMGVLIRYEDKGRFESDRLNVRGLKKV